jgi:DNA-binding transcriptional LysR family regulator
VPASGLQEAKSLTAGRDFGVLALRTWRLGDLRAKHALLLAGLGWRNMPQEIVAASWQRALLRLELAEETEHHYPISLVDGVNTPPGPAGRWLMERLAETEPQVGCKGGSSP